MIKRVFVIRHQSAGVLSDNIYCEPPTDADMAEARIRCLSSHGFGHTGEHGAGKPWNMWVEEVRLHVPDGCNVSELVDMQLMPPPAVELNDGSPQDRVLNILDLVKTSGTGIVVNPE